MRDDLRIRLRGKNIAFLFQQRAQREMILDDAVVYDGEAPGRVGVRVRVLVGRAAVRRPARVADAYAARDGLLMQHALERVQPPRRLAHA